MTTDPTQELLLASHNGSLDTIKQLRAAGENVNTPVDSTSIELIEQLSRHGIELNPEPGESNQVLT